MYLPTFWKLQFESYLYRQKHMAGYALPVGFLTIWILYPSLYNWTYSCIIPPPSGVEKQNN
jgi:hypothetical protein